MLGNILALLNEWWINENMQEEITKARVVLIFKKGDRENLANYRPISLLNTLYKILAAIVQKRLAEKFGPIITTDTVRIQETKRNSRRNPPNSQNGRQRRIEAGKNTLSTA